MRILNITAQKPDSTGSGVYLSELMKEFHLMGHKQALLAGVYKEDEIITPEEVQIYPVYFSTEELPFPIVGMSDEMPYKSTRYSDMTQDMTMKFREAFKMQIDRALQEFQPELILCHHLYYLTALVKEKAGDIPVYGISHGSDLRQIKKNPWQREYILSQIHRLDGIFSLHQEQKKEIVSYFSCEKEKVNVIGTGYNSHRFYINKEIQQKKCTEEIRLLFAGKISEKKGVMSLIRSLDNLKEMPDSSLSKGQHKLRLILAGGYGNEKEYADIQRLAGQAPYSVEFAGKLTQEELAKTMNESDIFVLPSFYEGLPLVVVEAMACGMDVVCTDLPGIRPWLDEKLPGHGVRFVTPPIMEREDEPVADNLPVFEKNLAEAIRETIRNREKLIRAKGNAVQIRPGLEKLSWKGLSKNILELVERG